MKIFAIDTSADETSCAVTEGRKVISHTEYSQILIHKKWGGIVPSIAKRAHEDRIDMVVEETLKRAGAAEKDIDGYAVTYGPGLAIALEVGIRKARELALRNNRHVIPVNHLEGHAYSPFVQNSRGNPPMEFRFPYLTLLVSGGHTQLVLFKGHTQYQLLGESIDDAAGEALDKAAKLMGLGYPGGPVIERLSRDAGNADTLGFPRPMLKSGDLRFSFSGLKTAFYYHVKDMKDRERTAALKHLVSSYQEAVFDTLLKKTEAAIKLTGVNRLTLGGGVSANTRLRALLRLLAGRYGGSVLFPAYKYLTGDNAAMIGVAAYYKAAKGMTIAAGQTLERVPRLSF